jgi:hypothetical protein
MLDRENPSTGNWMMTSRTACLVLSLAVALLAMNGPVGAAQIPDGCTQNGVLINIEKSATNINNGDTVTYTVSVGNGDFPPTCQTVNNKVQGFCPGPDGNPSATPIVTFPTISMLPAPTATFDVGTFDCVVTVNPGVTNPRAAATLSGDLQDNPNQNDPFTLLKTVSVIVATPPPPPSKDLSAIPTLSEWVFILLAVFVALVGVATLRKKQTV